MEPCRGEDSGWLDEETQLWRAIPSVPDLQCAWQLLVQCAGPRCHHFIRNVPPEHSVAYAQGHDRGMREVVGRLLEGLPGNLHQREPRSRTAGHVAHADGRTRFAFRMPHGASGLLGFVG